MKLTPAQQQYISIKQQHKDCLLLFRMGDFYELFYEDAHIAHRVLDITLTSRDKSAENPVAMAGIPYHALEKYLPKLIKAGYKVALAEQIGEVIPGKVVERKVTRIVTAATYIEHNSIAGVLCAIAMTNAPDRYHCGLLDVVTGSLQTLSFSHRDELIKYILKHNPTEIVVDIDMPERSSIENYLQGLLSCSISISDVPHNLDAFIKHHLGVTSLDAYGKALLEGRERVFGVIANYLLYTLKKESLFFTHISYGFPQGIVHIDDTTMRNLELFSSSYEQKSQHSLFAIINHCHSAMGSRLLMQRLQNPSNDLDILQERQQQVLFFTGQEHHLRNSFFEQIPDIPKILSILNYRGMQATRLQQLRNVASLLLEQGSVQAFLRSKYPDQDIDRCRQLFSSLEQAIIPSQVSGDQGYIVDGYDLEIDRLRQLVFHSDEVLLAYQQELIQITGINAIRLKYVQHQGYFLEIGKQHQEQFEKAIDTSNEKYDFQRRATLKTGERYVTSYLENLEVRVLEAKTSLIQREQQILQDFCNKILAAQSFFLQRGEILAAYDLASSHYQFSLRHQWVMPQFSDKNFSIIGGRHPIVEAFLGAQEQFIANDLQFDGQDSFHLITGPNMGGKTTYLKQNALILVLAHSGLSVPAASATIPLVDAIFARIGTGDILAKQQSTFMTEMIEMANILHNATSRSFLVLDEIGRGTSTYDGLALAYAICEYILRVSNAKTLFATHYHELTSLEQSYKQFHNYSVSVYETDKNVVFLKKIVKGGASKSYGIDVALRAGIPASVIDSAKKHLQYLESKSSSSKIIQQGLFQEFVGPKKTEIEDSLARIEIDNVTPMQALLYLQELQNKVSNL